MTYSLVLHPNVELELAEVAMWYEEQVPGLGEDFIIEFEDMVRYVRMYPFGFRIAFARFRMVMMRRFPFIITFEIEGDLILVSTLTHAKQHPRKRTPRRS